MILRALLVAVACVAGVAQAGIFEVTTTDDAGAGSLRQAILDANADVVPDVDVITFAIGTGQKTIQPATPLPPVTKAVEIDGSSQPGWGGTPLITIDGSKVAAGESGLVLANHTGSIVTGLAIGGFKDSNQNGGNGLFVDGGGGHTIVGSHFGTDATGAQALPNRYGIACVGCSDCTIGAPDPNAPRNVLSGNTDAGIILRDAANTVIQRNWIGLDADGTGSLPNGLAGVFMLSGTGTTNTTIGGDIPELGNVISGNTIGVTVGNAETTGTVIRNNLIGTDPGGTFEIGNWQEGIDVNGAPSTTIDGNVIVGSGDGIRVFNVGADGTVITRNAIGTDAAGIATMPNGTGIRIQFGASGAPDGASIGGLGAGNVIAHNDGAGIVVLSGVAANLGMTVSPTGVDVRENRIFANGGLAIDLEGDGVTPNDAQDVDDGANHLQNFPVVTGIVDMGDTIEFDGVLDAAPSTTYRLELFESADADPSGNGEAESPLGTRLVLTDEQGHVDFAVLLGVSITPGAFIAATATDPQGNTSELGPVFTIPGGATTSSTSTSSSSTSSTSTSSTSAPTSTTSSSSTLATTTSTATTTSSTSSTAAGGTTSSSSSTVVATTATTSTSLAADTSSTTTTPAPATTTTTTAGPTCPQEPFALLACDVARLQDAVASAVGLDAVRAKLGTRLGAAATNVEKARAACATRQTGRAKKALAKVVRTLGQCAKILRSRKGRTVPDEVRTALGGLVADAKSDVSIVKSGLTCR